MQFELAHPGLVSICKPCWQVVGGGGLQAVLPTVFSDIQRTLSQVHTALINHAVTVTGSHRLLPSHVCPHHTNAVLASQSITSRAFKARVSRYAKKNRLISIVTMRLTVRMQQLGSHCDGANYHKL